MIKPLLSFQNRFYKRTAYILFVLILTGLTGCGKHNQISDNVVEEMNTMNPKGLVSAAEQVLSTPEVDWWVRDLTSSYPWLGPNELFWVIDTETDDSAMVIKDNNDQWICLNQHSSIHIISTILRDQLGSLPSSKVNAAELAQLLMEWFQDPRGYVCSPEFLIAEEAVLDSFLVEETREQADNLRSVCQQAVSFSEMEGGKSELSFKILNRKGGVDQWSVIIDSHPFYIHQIDIVSLMPDDSFYYPDEL